MAAIVEGPTSKYECLLFGMYRALKIRRVVCEIVCPNCFVHSSKSCLLFATADLDDTLYPLSAGINLACRQNIQGVNNKSYFFQYLPALRIVMF